ncbi:MAG: xanthine dehydrogenase family protein subunit M [Pseudomonadota bacterium]|nr:xanthine dehydrogenase family protein subunit M [Pseudomonadota bacterium]MEC9458692.1 xanthine dehydrogenase family protein subunit M [Pseudomonadota bacterium]
MYKFNYHKVSSIEEAEKLLNEDNESKIISGGQTLIPTMKQRLASPSVLIDISGISNLNFIKEENNSIIIGANTKHSDVASSDLIRNKIPSLSDLAEGIGDPHVRNMGTIGGSISNNDPTADYPAACLGLDAVITTNKRDIISSDFFVGLFETALDENEIVVSISFNIPEKSSYMKFPNPASRYAMAGVYLSIFSDKINVSVTGASENGVFKWKDMEDILSKDLSVDNAKKVNLSPDGIMSDIHADSIYRANLVEVMAARAIENLK